MGLDIGDLAFKPAQDARRIPVVYSREEISAIPSNLRGAHRLQVDLMYGSG